jgi:hypothetical protein
MAQRNDCPNPKCRRRTFHVTPTGRECSACGHTMYVRPDNTGRGQQCNHCGNFQVFSHQGERWCRNCAAYYS